MNARIMLTMSYVLDLPMQYIYMHYIYCIDLPMQYIYIHYIYCIDLPMQYIYMHYRLYRPPYAVHIHALYNYIV